MGNRQTGLVEHTVMQILNYSDSVKSFFRFRRTISSRSLKNETFHPCSSRQAFSHVLGALSLGASLQGGRVTLVPGSASKTETLAPHVSSFFWYTLMPGFNLF